MEPPAPSRGGYRKRKRTADDQPSGSASTVAQAPADNSGTFSTFKFEPSPYPEEAGIPLNHANGYRRSVSPHHRPRRRAGSPHGPEDDDGYNSAESDSLPDYLLKQYNPETKTILGRSPAMIMYLLMKAKHRYALEHQESLIHELHDSKVELQRQWDEKDAALDQILGTMFGPQAEELMSQVPPPPGMTVSPSYPMAMPTHMNGNGR
ncbi:hypothetical protein C0991_003549 [Blastosporella zonata]|nr:hypothetical protein C0991_003549 [Blastosporella zonata]